MESTAMENDNQVTKKGKGRRVKSKKIVIEDDEEPPVQLPQDPPLNDSMHSKNDRMDDGASTDTSMPETNSDVELTDVSCVHSNSGRVSLFISHFKVLIYDCQTGTRSWLLSLTMALQVSSEPGFFSNVPQSTCYPDEEMDVDSGAGTTIFSGTAFEKTLGVAQNAGESFARAGAEEGVEDSGIDESLGAYSCDYVGLSDY